MNFFHTFHPQSVAITLGPIAVHWYGLFIVSGIFVGLFVALKLAPKYGKKKEQVYDISFYMILASIVGARAYAVLLFLPYYLQNPTEIIAIWRGGLAIHGALAGGLIALIFYCYKKRENFWQWTDIVVPALALGQAIGRWGNYFNQELYGSPTNLPWAIPIDIQNRVAGFENVEFFHPTFLYESLLNLGIFLLLVFMHLKPKAQSLKPGRITLIYLVLYSVVRIIMENFRIDETPHIFGLRLPVLVSIIIILVSIGLLFKKWYNSNTYGQKSRT